MTIEITPTLLRAIRPELSPKMAQTAAEKLNWALPRFGVTTPLRVAHLLAQLAHESGFQPVAENLNYSAARLTEVWPNRFPSLAAAAPYANKPEALANKTYGGRMGNTQPGDGWRYRGRGMIQLTGRANYRTYGGLIGHDLEGDPDLLLQYGISALVAGAYAQQRGVLTAADRDDVVAVTRAINGGTNGMEDRKKYLARARRALGLR